MTRARTNADQAHTESLSVEPHIIPGVLYPAVAGKLLDGSTSHSGNYGTAQADGYSYYYTDIKGSKPIKDPRIGGHFGSQRYKFTSLQLLEQETATEGKNIYSIDGREWLRAYTGNSEWINYYDQNGTYLQAPTDCTGNFIELTGYFNDINFAITTHSNRCDDIDISVNGTLSVDGSATLGGRTTVASPLGSRFVSMGSLINGGSTLSASLGTTPQINTVRYEMKTGSGEYVELHAIELIAQDTTSTANKSKIQIPSQNVVSYGKKFTVSGTPHYDPFNGFTNDTTLFSSVVDVATSLGLGTATTWGAPWDKGSNNHIRPFNGGRVVKWVDSSGTIKTSVTMMPANAQNVGTTASNEITTASATNSHTINFSDDAVESSLSEVAKTFHWREFGNGAANGGTGGSYADASMLNTADDIAYVMDDGLTSLSGDDARAHADGGIYIETDDKKAYFTFIGTGLSVYDKNDDAWETWAQNLPYGTHIMEYHRNATTDNSTVKIDGVQIKQEWLYWLEFTIHQPKKPPIPEDAVVLADYVQNTANGNEKISKGVRACSQSRDIFYNEIHGFTTSFYDTGAMPGMGYLASSSNTSNVDNNVYELPAFGTIFYVNGHTSQTKNDLWIDDTDVAQSGTTDGNHGDISYPDAAVELGLHKFQVLGNSGQDYSPYIGGLGFKIASPTHTSSHYQTFETPFLHELVGGDRNMEQNNLVVTPDGKTWDEVTRDTSYIGDTCVQTTTDSETTWATAAKFDEWRGMSYTYNPLMNKDFAIAYDRIICLVDGEYTITVTTRASGTGEHASINVSGQEIINANLPTDNQNFTLSTSLPLKRGDYVMFKGSFGTSLAYNRFIITRL